MKALVLIAGLAAGLLPGGAPTAQNLTQQDLLPGAQWYVHVNARLLRESALTAPFYDESLGEAFADIREEMGVDLGRDITAITVFGSASPGRDTAVVLHGRLGGDNRARLDELASTAGHFVEHDYGGARYIEVSGIGDSPGSVRAGQALMIHYGADKTLISTSESTMHRLLDPAGDAVVVEPDNPDTLLVLQADRSLVQAGMDARNLDLNGHWNSSLLNNVERAMAVVSERNGGLGIQLQVLTADEATATYVQNILQGLISLKALSGDDDPAMAELLNRLDLKTSARQVLLEVDISPELAAKIVDEM